MAAGAAPRRRASPSKMAPRGPSLEPRQTFLERGAAATMLNVFERFRALFERFQSFLGRKMLYLLGRTIK